MSMHCIAIPSILDRFESTAACEEQNEKKERQEGVDGQQATGRAAKTEQACRRFEKSAGIAPSAAGAAAPADISKASGFSALAGDRVNLRRTALLGALYMLAPSAAIGFPLLSAAVMVQKGFHISDSLLFGFINPE
jgi:hypothetical protein